MFESPAKRRKTAFAGAAIVDAFNTQSNPSTPKRASFQSPTKSSLARSHPNLLPQSASTSERQLRARSVRQELLGQRTSGNTPQASTTVSHAPNQRDQPRNQHLSEATVADAQSFSAAIAKRSVTEPEKVPASSRTPLRTRQPPIQLVDAQSAKADFYNSKRAQPKTRPVHRQSGKDVEAEEPDLPPTPVELGLDERPKRPRGLASSSPLSDSGRGRSRLSNSAQTSSPLKPKHQAKGAKSIPAKQLSTATGVPEADAPDEAPEGDIEHTPYGADDSAQEEVIQKRSLRDSLLAQLVRLKSGLSHLESALADPDRPPKPGDTDLLSLITNANPSCKPDDRFNPTSRLSSLSRSPSPSLIKPTTLGAHPLKHLTLFAPGNLHLNSTTNTDILHNKAHQIHTLELSAPPPWPPHVFGPSISICVDIEAKQIVRIEGVKFRGSAYQLLKSWVVRRLSAPLHRFDAAGLVWGMGRWWEECVRRARGWRRLDGRFRKQQPQTDLDDEGNAEDVVHPEEVRALLPFMETVAMSLDIPEPRRRQTGSQARTTGSDDAEATSKQTVTAKAQLFLEWRLELDWAGEVEEKVNLSVSGWGEKAQDGIKDTFAKIAKGRGNGVYKAMEAVWDVLEKGQG